MSKSPKTQIDELFINNTQPVHVSLLVIENNNRVTYDGMINKKSNENGIFTIWVSSLDPKTPIYIIGGNIEEWSNEDTFDIGRQYQKWRDQYGYIDGNALALLRQSG